MMRWTTEQDYALLARWELGDAWPLIATALGRPATACQARLRLLQERMTINARLMHDTLHRGPRRLTRREEAWLRRWHHEGLSAEHIARQLGCTAAEVCERLAVLEA